jgi:hypothetical protein
MVTNKEKEPVGLEELDFLNLVLMLGNTASIELGDKSPKDGTKQFNLPRARQFINMLAVLEKKTSGRRSPQEEEVLKKLMSDLQDKYVKASGLDHLDPQVSSLGRLAAQAYTRTRRNP